MATATAPITDKAKKVAEFRTELRTLSQDITELRSKLAYASDTLAALMEKRRVLAEEIADGKTHKPATLAALHADIAAAELPVSALQRRVADKEAALSTVRTTLESLDYEISIERQREARQARFQVLEKQGREVTRSITEKIRALIQDDLPALDVVRTALTREFVDAGGMLNGGLLTGEATPALALIHQLEGEFWDGSYLSVERALLREGWEPRGESGLSFTIRTLRPPK